MTKTNYVRTLCFHYSEDVSKLKYLSLCLKESLRLYPSVPNVHRDLEDDVEIDGYRIPKGMKMKIHFVLVIE